MYRKRFGLTDHPLAKDAQGKTFCPLTPGYDRLFQRLLTDPGLAVLTGEAGVGKRLRVEPAALDRGLTSIPGYPEAVLAGGLRPARGQEYREVRAPSGAGRLGPEPAVDPHRGPAGPESPLKG